jgi:hypothetical protein
MMRKATQEAKRRIEKIRQLMAKAHSPHRRMTKQEIIDEIRKTREKLWEAKLATHSR